MPATIGSGVQIFQLDKKNIQMCLARKPVCVIMQCYIFCYRCLALQQTTAVTAAQNIRAFWDRALDAVGSSTVPWHGRHCNCWRHLPWYQTDDSISAASSVVGSFNMFQSFWLMRLPLSKTHRTRPLKTCCGICVRAFQKGCRLGRSRQLSPMNCIGGILGDLSGSCLLPHRFRVIRVDPNGFKNYQGAFSAAWMTAIQLCLDATTHLHTTNCFQRHEGHCHWLEPVFNWSKSSIR